MKIFNGPFGNIRNYPRKDKLERDIREFSPDLFTNENLSKDPPMAEIEKVLIIGSWGRGTARPFVSDLDVVPLGYPTRELSTIKTGSEHLIFNGIQIFALNPDNVKLILGYGAAGAKGHGWLHYEKPHKAYNLTDREDIKIVDGEFVGLNLE